VQFVLVQAGLHVPEFIGQDGGVRRIRHTNEFWDYYGVAVHQLLRRSGDLIVFSRNGTRPTHIGIVRDEESYIHAPGKDGTRVTAAGIETEEIKCTPEDAVALYCVNPIGYKAPAVAVEQPTYRIHQQPI
jgi:hypothetical protein